MIFGNPFKKKGGRQTSDGGSHALLGSRERRLLAESARIEEELVPAFVRPLLGVAGIAVVSFVIWAALTDLTEVARAQGEIAPSGQSKVVQHLDGGTVSEIKVKEHELVQEGQELFRINGSQAVADLRQMDARLISLRLRAERLQAFADGREPDFTRITGAHPDMVADQMEIYRLQMASRNSTLSVLDRQIDQRTWRIQQLEKSLAAAREQQALTGELSNMRESLASRRLVNRTVLLETKRAKVTADSESARLTDEIDVVGQELAEFKNRRTDSINQMRKDAMNEVGAVRAEIAEAEEAIQRLGSKVDRLVVTAPIRGYAHDIKVQTVGQVVQPGALLMQIVPSDAPLEAVVHIAPRDIAYVKVDQPVNMRISSYDYTSYGFARGILKQISATSIVGEDGKPYFRGWVALTHPYVGDKPGNLLQAGMGVEAEILTGHRTMLAYILKPLKDINSRSFGER